MSSTACFHSSNRAMLDAPRMPDVIPEPPCITPKEMVSQALVLVPRQCMQPTSDVLPIGITYTCDLFPERHDHVVQPDLRSSITIACRHALQNDSPCQYLAVIVRVQRASLSTQSKPSSGRSPPFASPLQHNVDDPHPLIECYTFSTRLHRHLMG